MRTWHVRLLAGHHHPGARLLLKDKGKALMPENMPWEAHCQQTVE